jgi:hypothetical protein
MAPKTRKRGQDIHEIQDTIAIKGTRNIRPDAVALVLEHFDDSQSKNYGFEEKCGNPHRPAALHPNISDEVQCYGRVYHTHKYEAI